jgi:predicted nucleic acid-binding protein
MRAFLDTNVLASAFGSRSLCADVLRLILAEHELVTGEVVIEELITVLRRKFRVPPVTVRELAAFLREFADDRRPAQLPKLPLRERQDLLVVGSALATKSDALLTGNGEILALRSRCRGLKILPRESGS